MPISGYTAKDSVERGGERTKKLFFLDFYSLFRFRNFSCFRFRVVVVFKLLCSLSLLILNFDLAISRHHRSPSFVSVFEQTSDYYHVN